jgi:hypothetical protein
MTPKFSIRRALLGTALYLLLALAIKKLGPLYLAPETVLRLGGMWIAVPVIVFANALPKSLVPLDRATCDPAIGQAMRRFVARALVLGGIGFVLAYALAPVAIANSLAASLLLIALIAAIVRVVRTVRRIA